MALFEREKSTERVSEGRGHDRELHVHQQSEDKGRLIPDLALNSDGTSQHEEVGPSRKEVWRNRSVGKQGIPT